jgi:PAS domain S-box-containing protein
VETDQLTDSLQETLAVFETVEPGTPLTTSEVTDALDVGRRSTYDRLERLVDSGRLETKEVGARGRVWWVPVADGQTDVDGAVTDVLAAVDAAAVVSDADGEVLWYNDAAETAFDLSRERVVGRPRRAVVLEELAPRVESTVEFAETVLPAGQDAGQESDTAFKIATDGEQSGRRLSFQSLSTATGDHVDLFEDVTDESSEGTSDERFERLVDSIGTHGVFEIDPDGRIQTWNDGAEQITGYDAESIVGEPLATLYPESCQDAGVPGRHLEVATTSGTSVEQGWRVRADGEQFWAQTAITALRGADGFGVVLHDLTERQDLLETILQSSPTGIAVFDADGYIQQYNEQFETLVGIDPDEASAYSLGGQRFLDSDGEPIPDEELPAVRALETGEPVSGGPIQVDEGDGRRWITVEAQPTDGAIVVTVSDVTQLQSQGQRREQERGAGRPDPT